MDAKFEVLNAVAVKHGFKNWDELWWKADLTIDMMEDAFDAYGKQQYDIGFAKGFDFVKVL